MASKTNFTRDSMLLVAVVIFTILSNCDTVQGRHFVRIERSDSSANTETPIAQKSQDSMTSTTSLENKETTVVCDMYQVCGWAVYEPITRELEYFMRNTCVCPKDKDCVRSENKISLNAYVYRCRVGT